MRTLESYAESLTIPLPDELPPFDEFKEIHCNFSGGVDSIAKVLLYVYGYKVPKEKIRLVHMRVDGGPEKEQRYNTLFDWPQTDQYLEYCCDKLGIELEVIYPELGLGERIMDRGQWPAPGVQFCTSYVKRDVYSKWVRRRGPGLYLCASGERAQESPSRSRKPPFQIYTSAHAVTKERYVYWHRPILHLKTDQVWELMKLADIEPHPCYQFVSRCSCRFCIFISPKEMKMVSELYPKEFEMIIQMEKELGHTMKFKDGKGIPIEEFVAKAGKEQYEQMDLMDLPCRM